MRICTADVCPSVCPRPSAAPQRASPVQALAHARKEAQPLVLRLPVHAAQQQALAGGVELAQLDQLPSSHRERGRLRSAGLTHRQLLLGRACVWQQRKQRPTTCSPAAARVAPPSDAITAGHSSHAQHSTAHTATHLPAPMLVLHQHSFLGCQPLGVDTLQCGLHAAAAGAGCLRALHVEPADWRGGGGKRAPCCPAAASAQAAAVRSCEHCNWAKLGTAAHLLQLSSLLLMVLHAVDRNAVQRVGPRHGFGAAPSAALSLRNVWWGAAVLGPRLGWRLQAGHTRQRQAAAAAAAVAREGARARALQKPGGQAHPMAVLGRFGRWVLLQRRRRSRHRTADTCRHGRTLHNLRACNART